MCIINSKKFELYYHKLNKKKLCVHNGGDVTDNSHPSHKRKTAKQTVSAKKVKPCLPDK